MLQNVLPGENSGQNSCFLRVKSPIIHEKNCSGRVLVPKSRFYRFYMDFGTQHGLLLVTLGLLWIGQGDLGGRLGAQIDPKLEILTKCAPQSLTNHQNYVPKSIKRSMDSTNPLTRSLFNLCLK